MSVVITSKKFYSEFALPTPFEDAGVTSLDKCVGDKIKAIIEFYVKWSTENQLLRFDATAKTISRVNDLEFGSFIEDGFKAGDTIAITGTTSNNGAKTIASVTDRDITLTTAPVNETAESANIFGTTPVTSVDFYYNLIKNSAPESYLSLVDRYTQQKYYADAISATVTGSSTSFKIGTNSYGWVTELSVTATGDVSSNTIVGTGITSDYRQSFKITQYFFNVPIWLMGQNSNFESPQFPPAEYADTECLKYICRVDAKFDKNNPNIPHTGSDTATNGVTSWFNENQNGHEPEYTLTSITYKDSATLETLEKLDINKTVNVEVHIASKSGFFLAATGVTSGTFIVLNYARCAQDETEYINTKTNFRQNFHYDRVMIAIGFGADGENTLTDYQVLQSVFATFISASSMKINFTVDLATFLRNALKVKGEEDRNYLFWITTERRADIIPS